MRVLIVCSHRDYSPHTDYMAPFVYEQVHAIESMGVECRVLLVGKGLKGYLVATKHIKDTIRTYSPDIVHAHYGLCGLIANLQRIVPVVTTYHGTDVHDSFLNTVSQVSVLLSRKNIVVSKELAKKLLKKNSVQIIPCGVNADLLVPMERIEACIKLGWDPEKKRVLFSKEFYNKAKNYPLAKAAIEEYNSKYANDSNAELLEFIGYSREQVLLLYNAVSCVLMTSDHEGSPQFIKEAMACNCPIVSVDVGDVKHVISGVGGCFLAERNADDIARKLDSAINYGKTTGREKVLQEFESSVVARKIIDVYKQILDNE